MVLPPAQGLETSAGAELADNNCAMPDISSDDPLDFFGAIRDLVERGLTPEERAKLGAMQEGEEGAKANATTVNFPRVSERQLQEEPRGDVSEAELPTTAAVAALQRELAEAKERIALETASTAQACEQTRAAELEANLLREKHREVVNTLSDARADQAAAERDVDSFKDEITRLEEALAKTQEDAEVETAKASAAAELDKTEVGVLRSQLGAPTATQLENPQFIAIFEGGTKVDLTSKLLTTTSYKKDLEFSVSKLVQYKQKVEMLKGANEGLQQERDRAKLERDRLKQLIDKLAEQQTQAAAGVEDAKKLAAAAVRREREELLRVKEKLAFERAEYRRYRDKTEAQLKRLRKEAERAEELEEQLDKKTLKIKQKEAEVRALAVDGKEIRELRQSVCVKEDHLKNLRLEMASMRIATEAAEKEAKLTEQLKEQLKQQRGMVAAAAAPTPGTLTGDPQANSHSTAVSSSPGRWGVPRGDAVASTAGTAAGADGVVPGEDMTCTQSMSSVGSVGDEDDGLLGAIPEEGDEEDGVEQSEQQEEEAEVEEEVEVDGELEGVMEGSTVSDAPGGEETEKDDDKEEDGDDQDVLGDVGDVEDGQGGDVEDYQEYVDDQDPEEFMSELGPEEADDISDAESEEMGSEVGEDLVHPTNDANTSDGSSVTGIEEGEEDEEGDEEEDEVPASDAVSIDLAPSHEDEAESFLPGDPSAAKEDGEAPSAEEGKGPTDDDAGIADSSASKKKKQPRLSLERGMYAETDEEAEAFAAATFAVAEHATGKAIVFDTAAAAAPAAGASASTVVSYSVSPRPYWSPPTGGALGGACEPFPIASGSEQSRRRTHIQAPSVSALAMSPMARLAPAEHGIKTMGNAVVIELGTWKVRVGVVESRGDQDRSSFFDDFPCSVARPTRKGADLDELVNGASSLAAPMYSKFRETGLFVGGDAWYCCLDHPDSGLRSQLTLSCPLDRGRVRLRDGSAMSDDTERLLDHAFGLLKQDPTTAPTLVTYKPTATPEEVWEVASILLENHRVPAVRLVNEAQLAALAAGVTTGVLVDIGESGVYITPIFEGLPVAKAVRSVPCGGGDLTRYLDYMLISRTNEQFNQMVDRRRLEYTRKVKEGHCFVPLDFQEEAERCGNFRRKTMRVFEGAQVSPKLSAYEACSSQQFNDDKESSADNPVTVSFTQKAGTQLNIKIGRERFHAPELLFQPELWSEMESEDGLDDLVLAAVAGLDADVRTQMLGDVVLVGGSAALPGLLERLEQDLMAIVPEHLCDKVHVRVLGDDVLRHSNNLSRGSATAVTVGAEALLRAEERDRCAWIKSSEWEESSDVLRRRWYIL